MKPVDRRFRQARREALWSVALAVLFFLWWYGFAYGLAGQNWYLWGLPAWFFFSSILGPVLFCCLAWMMVKFLFRPLSLEAHEAREEAGSDVR